nr:hypothetical protein BaRGS_013738 [Batillaria attramentaria]
MPAEAALLFAMGRAWEVAERSFDFLHNTVAEMKALNQVQEIHIQWTNYKKPYLHRVLSKSITWKISEAQKAEVFLLDAIKMYRQEGWVSLAHATMRELATCQKQMGNSHRKYVQITLSGDSNTNFVITSPELSSPVAGFTFLNPTQEWSVSSKQAVSFVWQLEDAKDGEELDIAATFTCQFTCEVDLTRQVQKFTYDCRLSHFQTWYILDYWLSGEMLPAAADLKSHETSSWKTKMAGYKADALVLHLFF